MIVKLSESEVCSVTVVQFGSVSGRECDVTYEPLKTLSNPCHTQQNIEHKGNVFYLKLQYIYFFYLADDGLLKTIFKLFFFYRTGVAK